MFEAIERRLAPLDLTCQESSEEQAREYLKNAKAVNTLRAYRADWTDFSGWCLRQRKESLPSGAATLVLYLTELSNTAKPSTLSRRLAAISHAHQIAGFDSPTKMPVVRNIMAGIRRTRGSAPITKKPILVEDLKLMLSEMPATILGLRDRALLLLGFTGAFRRSELVGLDRADLATDNRGLVITIRKSKTDQEWQGRTLGIPHGSPDEGTCPIAALEAWIAAAAIVKGPLFRVVNRHGQVLPKRLSGAAVAMVIKRRVKSFGGDPTQFAGHSLRAGLATSAAIAGKSERAIMQQTGHRSLATVRRYIREGNLFRENAAEGLGL